MVDRLHIYIVTTNQWLSEINQGYLISSVIGRLVAINDPGIPLSCTDVFFASNGGGTTKTPYVNIDGVLVVQQTNGRVLNLVADCIAKAAADHIYGKTHLRPIVHCNICSLNDSLHGTVIVLDQEPAEAAAPGAAGA